MTAPIKIIFGTAAPWSLLPPDQGEQFFPVLEKHRVTDIDTSAIYFGSEKSLGILNAPSRFTVHTKTPGLSKGCLSKESIRNASKKSFAELGVTSVQTYFLHTPDESTPISETMEAIQELYVAGKFKQFGVSNFTAPALQDLYDYAHAKGYVTPSVYEGNYSPITRHLEVEIFPLIRKLGMSFFAYSPLAGGFLTKSAAVIKEGKEPRWNKETRVGAMYQRMFNRPKLMHALTDWERIAEQAGITKAELAFRWVAHHSSLSSKFGDAIIVGASRPSQLDDTLRYLSNEPLSPVIVGEIQALWETVKSQAPIDAIHG